MWLKIKFLLSQIVPLIFYDNVLVYFNISFPKCFWHGRGVLVFKK